MSVLHVYIAVSTGKLTIIVQVRDSLSSQARLHSMTETLLSEKVNGGRGARTYENVYFEVSAPGTWYATVPWGGIGWDGMWCIVGGCCPRELHGIKQS